MISHIIVELKKIASMSMPALTPTWPGQVSKILGFNSALMWMVAPR
jgi:hypothetical protein